MSALNSYITVDSKSVASLPFVSSQVHHSFLNKSEPYTKVTFITPADLLPCAYHKLLDLPNNLPYLLDGVQFKVSPNDYLFQYNLNSMSTDSLDIICVKTSLLNFELNSISHIFESASWLERELSEFTGVLFYNSRDSRRLLLDYTEAKNFNETHRFEWRDFSNIYYEILHPTWVCWESEDYE